MKLGKHEIGRITDAIEIIEVLKHGFQRYKEEYQNKFDALSDKEREGEKGQEVAEFVEDMQKIVKSLESAVDSCFDCYEAEAEALESSDELHDSPR